TWDEAPAVLMVSLGERPFGDSQLRVEAVSPRDGVPTVLLRALRAAMRENNVYRGRVISLHGGDDQSIKVSFQRIPEIRRGDVVLPAGTLERLERHTLGIASHAERL